LDSHHSYLGKIGSKNKIFNEFQKLESLQSESSYG